MNLSLKAKLFLGFSLVLLLLVAISFFLTGKLSEANERTTQIVNVSAKKISTSREIMALMLDVTRQEKNIILENDLQEMKRHEEGIRRTVATCNERLTELQLLVDEEGNRLLQRFAEKWKSYQNNLESIITLSKQNNNAAAFRLSVDESYKVREDAINMLSQLVAKNEQEMVEDKRRNDENYNAALRLIIFLVLAGFILAAGTAYWIIRVTGRRIAFIAQEARKIASREFTEYELRDPEKDELSTVFNSLIAVNQSFREITKNADQVASGDYSVDFMPRSSRDTLGNALKKMTVSLRESTAENKKHIWLATGQNKLNESLRGDKNLEELSNNIVSFLCNYVGASAGALYLLNDDQTLTLTGRHAYASLELREKFRAGEGLVGQAASDGQSVCITAVEGEHIRVVSALMDAKPKMILVKPFQFEGRTLGVIELAHLTGFSPLSREFLASCLESIAISIHSAISRQRIRQLLEETQVQSEELQSQQEELKQMNEELEEQSQNLRQQQEELQMTNEELESQTKALEWKNREMEKAREEIEQKSKQLEISSKYKSEFLANMSHELRTPLNSLLILSKDLLDNRSGNLTPEQVESAEIINRSGHDLLELINEVLDLSKIEAGKMSIDPEPVNLNEFVIDLHRDFRHHAEKKSLRFSVNRVEPLPATIVTDRQRLGQILKNLLSNAIKFTEQGEISVTLSRPDPAHIQFAVSDTGIGIPEDKQLAIFEAFQQADGGTSRKYGGTGLGLSISRELTRLLQGKITLESRVGQGSVFSLIIPIKIDANPAPATSAPLTVELSASTPLKEKKPVEPASIEDDRDSLRPGDKTVLIIEDDPNFATILRNQARQKGFKVLAAGTGEEGLSLAAAQVPTAIILDIDLPGINGYQVLSELKGNPNLRHIPVHIISVNERSMEAIKNGAIEYLTKPVNKKQVEEVFNRIKHFFERPMKSLLIIEDDADSRKSIRKLIGNGDVQSFEAATGKQAIEIFSREHIDCIVLDIGLPDISGFELIHKLIEVKKGMPPVIVYTGRDLTKEEDEELQKYAKSIIIKGTRSEERLLDETALFLHRTIDNLPEPKQQIIARLYDKDLIFRNKNILLVDDDMRNVFALSKMLKDRGMVVTKADNGKVAIEALRKNPGIDMVLMDIMMPEMDGYEAMKAIRADEALKQVPIIALTAKAMKEDKKKCIDAGANDYITKPVDVERLLSLMSVWLSRQ